jgi:hypothetical protein
MRTTVKRTAVALALLGALHTGAWFWATGAMAQAVAQWAAAQRAQGVSVSFRPAGRTGWPLAAGTGLSDLRIGGVAGVAAETVQVSVSLLHPRTLVVRFAGATRLTLAGQSVATLRADRLEARLPLTGDAAPRSATLNADALRIGGDSDVWLTVRAVRLRADVTTVPPAGAATLAVALQAGPAALPDPLPPGAPQALAALGREIQRLDLDATMPLPTPLPGGPLATATAWRDAGGTVKVALNAFDWGRLSATGTATGGLDAALQPTGQARLRLAGFTETLDALVAGHVMAQRSATAAGAILSLLARPRADGTPEVDAPLTLQDRVLQFGRFPLARLPPLQWPSAP